MSTSNNLLHHKYTHLSTPGANDPSVGITLPEAVFSPPVGSVIFDTTGQSHDGYGPLNSLLFGQSFTTGGTAEYLTDLKLDLAITNPGDGGSFSVKLYSDGGGTNGPATQLATLATFNDSQFSAGLTLEDVALASNPTLAPNTRYWIVLQGDATTSSYWAATGDLSGTEASTELNDIVGSTRADTVDGLALQMSVTTDTCFAEGTSILTACGELPVESLRPGDKVMALRRGGLATVQWVGYRCVDLLRHPNRGRLDPVRIQKDAFAPRVPHRDLFVSPDHALYVDGALVTVRHLLNGASIAQTTPNEITYFHVELDSHDVLLAENLAAESFLDVGNRAAFANGGAEIMAHPDFSRRTWDARACAPGLHTPEQRAPLRARLRARIPELGYETTQDADLRILAGSTLLRPAFSGNIAQVTLPPGTEEIRLVSRTASPKHFGPENADGRCLGIGVRRLTLDGNEVNLNHPALAAGWHAPESNLRWTRGDATLRTGGAISLTLQLLPGLAYWWMPDARKVAKIA